MTSFRARKTVLLFSAIVSSAIAWSGQVSAATAVRFSPEELAAVTTLAKPEQTSVRLNGRTGELFPGPALIFLGVGPQEFEVSIEGAGSIAGLRFNNLQARGLTLGFDGDRVRVDLPFVDQEKAIRSTFGAIHLRGVTLHLWTKVAQTAAGAALFELDAVELRGELKGTGIFSSGSVLDQVREAIVKQVKKKVIEGLAKPEAPDAIEKGLVTWAQFSQAKTLERTVPGTLKISANGVEFEAE